MDHVGFERARPGRRATAGQSAVLDFAHLAVEQECKLLCAVGTKNLIVLFWLFIS